MSRIQIAKDVFAFFMVSLLFLLASEETMVVEHNMANLQPEIKKQKQVQPAFQQPANCFAVNYPIQIVFPNGHSRTVANQKVLDRVVDNWFERNPNANDEPTFKYPFNITMQNGRKIIIDSEEKFLAVADACDQQMLEANYNSVNTFCFDFIYPMKLVTPTGNLLEVKSDDEVDKAIINWSIQNPHTTEELAIHFPIKIRFDDGIVIDLDEVNALSSAIQYCENGSLEYEEGEEEVDSTSTIIGA